MRIFEVCDTLNTGDGVGKDIFSKQRIFQELGASCDVYAWLADAGVQAHCYPLDELKTEKEDVILFHYSGYCIKLRTVLTQPAKKILVYHNITPPAFFQGYMRSISKRGLRQLKIVGRKMDQFIADSPYNLECLKALDICSDGTVLPIEIEFPEPQKCKKKGAAKEKGATFLFIGRMVPNKRIEDVIRTFIWYYENIDRSAQLYLVGNDTLDLPYISFIQRMAEESSAAEAITFWGKVSDEKLYALFSAADVYLSMSEHEGFGIPLIEAMWFGVPVFAFDAGAIKNTMGNAGVIFNEKQPEAVGKLIAAILRDEETLAEILEAQNRHVKVFSHESIKKRIKELLTEWEGAYAR